MGTFGMNEFSTTLFLISITIAIWLVLWYMDFRHKMNRIYGLLGEVKFVPGFPIIGNIDLFCRRKQFTDYLKKYCDLYQTNFGIWVGYHPFLILLEVEDVQRALLSPYCANKSFLSEEISKMLGDGLVTSEAKKHRKMRKIIQPAFNLRNLKTFITTFNERSEHMAEEVLPKLNGKVDSEWFETFEIISLDVIKRTMFGLKNDLTHIHSTSSEDLVKHMNTAEGLVHKRMNSIFLRNNFLFQLNGLEKMFDFSYNIVRDYSKAMINYNKQRMKEMSKVEKSKHTEEDEDSIKSMIEFFLQNEKIDEVGDENILSECQQILAAGLETSSASLCNFFSCMSLHQDVQEKVFEEIINVIGPEDMPSVEDLLQLNYLDRCLKETLRLMQPVVFIGRTVTEKDIQLTDFVAPVGTTLAVNLDFIHRSPKYWKNPEKFDPDRFLPEEVANRHPFAFIPFAAGIRMCIGDKYTILFQKCVIVSILRKYKCYCENKSLDDLEMINHIVSRAKKYFFYFEKRC